MNKKECDKMGESKRLLGNHKFLFFIALVVLCISTISGDTHTCTNCSDCQNVINNVASSGDTISLTANLTGVVGSCVGMWDTAGYDNMIFDCGGRFISGDNESDDEWDAGIYTAGNNNTKIQNCNVSGFSVGIAVEESTYTTISNNIIQGAYLDSAIYIIDSNRSLIISNNITGISYAALYTRNATYNNFTGNKINSGSGIYGAIFVNADNNSFTRNNITTTNRDGIMLGLASDNNLFTGNNISSPSADGVYIYELSRNNTFVNNNISSGSNAAVSMDDARNNTFTGNTIISNASYGVYASNTNYTSFTSNIINSTSFFGVSLEGYCNGNNFTSNKISSNSNIGLMLLDLSNNNSFTSNNISSNASEGVYVESSHNNSFTGNNMSSNFAYGLSLYNLTYNSFTNNTIPNGAYIDLSNYSTFTNNTMRSTGDNYGAILSSSNNNNFTRNNLTSNTEISLRLQTAKNNSFTNNNIISNSSYAVSVSASNNNTFTTNNISSNSSYGVRLSSSSLYNNFTTNNISSNSNYGVYLISSHNNSFTSNNISSNSSPGTVFDSSNYNLFINNNITSYVWYGLSLYKSNYSTFTNNTIMSNTAMGVYLNLSNYNNFTNNNLSSKENPGVLLENSDYNPFTNCNISSKASSYDFYLIEGSWNNSAINSTFNKSKTYITSGSLNVLWYLDVFVNDSNGALANATINGANNSASTVFNVNTSATGWITTQTLQEYMQNTTSTYYSTNYTINASKNSSYANQSRQVNLTNSTIVYFTMQGGDAISPKWFNNQTNSTTAGTAVKHSVNWTDDVALSGYIFSFDNGTGTLANDSWVAFTGVYNWSNVTKVVNSTSGSTIRWMVYTNDSSNNKNVTSIFQYTTSETTSPKWYNNQTNSTVAGSAIKHSVNWTDNVALSGYIFSFDNGTGTLTNDSWVAFTGISNWSNVTKVVNSTSGSTIRWMVYVNDTSNNFNVTSIFQYTTSDSNVPPTYSNNQVNSTLNGGTTKFSLLVNDLALHPNGTYIFSTNNTGVWANDSAINFTATPSWANVTKVLNNTVGLSVGYRWYLYDTLRNANSTPVYTLLTTEASSRTAFTGIGKYLKFSGNSRLKIGA